MEQIKSLYRIVLLPLLGGAMLAACEKDNGEETRVSEFGPVQKEYVTDWKSGTGSVSVLSNQPYDIALIDPDNGWLEIDTEGRGTHFTGDDKFGIRFDTNDGFPRMEGIRLWTRDRADTVYIKQEGFTNPKLNFSTRSITVLGDGGQATAQLTTNLELEDLQQQIVYTSDDVYCASKETTFEFVEEVLSEVLDLFPSKLIHIGGDECPKSRWKACPHCQQRIREEGLKDEYELQSYFIRRIERWMHTRGREIIGWDEILQGGISKTAIVMSWNGKEPGIKAARQGNPVIMTPKWHCYFDYSQTSDPDRYEPLGNPRYVPVRQVYRLEPYDQLALPDQKRIMGVQCNLWTEYIGNIGHAQHMVLPRMAALSEIGWACDRKDYNDFVRRVPALVRIYEAEGYRYAPYLFEGIE